MATNLYITDYLTREKGFTGSQAGNLLLVSGGIGFLFHVLGGLIGEKWGRREVLIGTGLLVAPLNLLFLFVQDFTLVAIVYFLIYQVTNGTWSGAGYAYQAESFPTRVRGTAVGFLDAMFARRRPPRRSGSLDPAHQRDHPDRDLAHRCCRPRPGPVAYAALAPYTTRPRTGGNRHLTGQRVGNEKIWSLALDARTYVRYKYSR